MIGESSRGTEARWTAGAAGCPEGVRARAERPNQLDVPSTGQARLHRSYAWGLDASGTLTGAGGVGGLLLTSHHTPQADGSTQVTTLAPLYDFNGNVLAYADVATSKITHRMEYDPFGQELSLHTLLPGEGVAEAPRFRFSTKYTDGETGLVYYGYRYYAPELGRWLGRDPIEESGGINLYGMVGNDAQNAVDHLGLLKRKRKWDCRKSSHSFQLSNERVGASVGGLGFEGVISTRINLNLETCKVCCGGKVREETSGGGDVVLRSELRLYGGPQNMNSRFLRFHIGVRGVIQGEFGGGVSVSSACGEGELTGSVGGSVTGRVELGGMAQVDTGFGSPMTIEIYGGGYVSVNGKANIKCNSSSCQIGIVSTGIEYGLHYRGQLGRWSATGSLNDKISDSTNLYDGEVPTPAGLARILKGSDQ